MGKIGPGQTLKLRGLSSHTEYRATKNGELLSKVAGQKLREHGLPVNLANERRASLFEVQAEQDTSASFRMKLKTSLPRASQSR